MSSPEPKAFPSREEITEHFRKVFPTSSEESVEEVIEDVMMMPKSWHPFFIHWWHTGEIIGDIEVKGLTVQNVHQEHRTLWDIATIYGALSHLHHNPENNILYMHIVRPTAII